MRQITLTNEQFAKLNEAGIEFKEKPIYEMVFEACVRDSIEMLETDNKYGKEAVDKTKAHAESIANRLFNEIFVGGDESDATAATDTLFDIAYHEVMDDLDESSL